MENRDEKLVTGIDISNKEYEEIVKKSTINKNISEIDKQKLIKKLSSLSAYEQELDKIAIPSYNNKVIFTNGNNQLLFENGEFFETSSIDATKPKVKLTRKEATDRYIEYFIGNVLNPLISRKAEMGIEYKKRDEKAVQEETQGTLVADRTKKQEKEDIEFER